MLRTENSRISTVGLVARSPEGHAAKGMQIKGKEDLWIEIQAHTFRNWVNEHLRPLGLQVNDLSTDLCDGTKLVALVEALQKRTLRKIHSPQNQHQMLENVTRALDAISADGVKLVNIGNVDIVNGNLKLILGLIWSLIVRYQIGRSKFPPKKLMLAWLRSVIPDTQINNFTTDWNSGVNLSALVDYCRPGLFPQWRDLDSKDGEYNCKIAMDVAKRELGVPVVLEPEYLASPHLDELSGMTYISYFMRENGPGYKATMNWVRNQLPERHISNFTSDWNNGQLLCELVRTFGGPVPGMDTLSTESERWESNLAMGMKGGEKLGITSILRPKDMADPSVDHLGIMAYTAAYQWLPARAPPGQRLAANWDSDKYRKGIPLTFILEYLEENTEESEIVVEVKGPSDRVDCRLNFQSGQGKGTFTASEIGIHEVVVKYQGEPCIGSPLKCRVLPTLGRVTYTGLEPCAVGSMVEVSVNPQDTSPSGAKLEYLEVIALSPSGVRMPCPVSKNPAGFAATFKPNEAGEWNITVMYRGKDIQGSPFQCFVFDPNGVKLDTLEGAAPGLPFAFICDSRGTGGLGEVDMDITHEGRSIPYNTEYIADGVKRILLPVLHGGKHRVHIYFNGAEIRGSPFSLRVGSSRSRHHNREQGKTRSFDRDEVGLGMRAKDSSFTSILKNSSQQSLDETTTFRGGSPSKPPKLSSFEEIHSPSQLTQSQSESKSKFSSFDETRTSSPFSTHKSKLISFEETRSSSPAPIPPIKPIKFSSSSASAFDETRNTSTNTKSKLLTSFEEREAAAAARSSSPAPAAASGSTSKSKFINLDLNSQELNDSIDAIHSRLTKNGTHFKSKSSTKDYSSTQEDLNLSSASALKSSNFANNRKSAKSPFISNVSNTVASPATSNKNNDIYSSRTSKFEDNSFESKTKRVTNSNTNGHMHTASTGVYQGDLVVDGDGLGIVPIHSTANVTITSEFGQTPLENVNVEISGPSGRVPVRIVDSGSSISAKYIPVEAGEHLINVVVFGHPIDGSPFRAAVFNANAIKVTRVPNGVVGRPVEIEIDGRGAGPGHLAILVDGGRVTSQVKALGDHRFRAVFLPHDIGPHSVDMTFNGIVVQGSPWRVNVAENTDGKMASTTPEPRQSDLNSDYLMIKGDPVRHVRFGKNATFEISAPGFSREAVDITVLSPTRKALSYRLLEEGSGIFVLEFTPSDVGTHLVEVIVAGRRLSVVAKVYNSSLIRVLDVAPGVIGQTSQFKVDASQAGEGQLEISINDGELPNQVRVLGGGCCLVSFSPEQAKPHAIDIKFNGETIPGCPILCQVADTRQVAVSLSGLELIPVHQTSRFHIAVDGSNSAELAVSVKGPSGDLPVKVSGSVRSGFTAEFTPREVGPHSIAVHHNGAPAPGTPFIAKAYDAKRVYVSPVPRGALGRSIQFTVDASQAGEGNLEITIGAKGRNVPTQVHPQGGARFAVSFVPLEPVDHTVTVTFNKEPVPGSPFVATVSADPGQIVVTGPSLAAAPIGKPAHFSLNNVHSALEDVEVAVEAGRQSSSSATYHYNYRDRRY